MVKLCVMYVGQPADPAAFDAYYWGTHLPTVQKWPRIRRISLAKGAPGDELYQVADLWFDSRVDLDAAPGHVAGASSPDPMMPRTRMRTPSPTRTTGMTHSGTAT